MIDYIRNILQKKYCQTITNNLELKDSQSKQKVSITKLPNKVLVIDIPRGVHLGIIEDLQNPKIKKSCDKLILVQRNNAMDAYFIEMKKTLTLSGKDAPEKACTQIICTIPILDYLVSMVRTHSGKTQNINKYFVIITGKLQSRIDKQTVKPKQMPKYKYENRSFKIIHSVSALSFRDLR